MHHDFTTIYHHAIPQNPQKALQNSHSTTPELIAPKTSKKLLSPKFAQPSRSKKRLNHP
jgi:hypothetical protein